MLTFLQDLRQELIVYRNDERPRVRHAAKSALAVVLAMLICMRLELRSPGTSMVSAVIVTIAQQSGMTIARAFYRTIGICCGALAGFALIALFAQAPLFFLAGLALWVGFCVAGSSYYKNFQSYGFVLSGYAACITAVPEWANPYDITDNIIYTVSEVVIGVAAGSLVSALVFPQKVVPALQTWRANALASLLSAYRAAALDTPPDDSTDFYLKLVRDDAALEDLRTAAVFEEPEMRLRNDALVELERTYLDSIARVHAIYRARRIAAQAGVDAATRARLEALFGRLAAMAQQEADDELYDRLHAAEAALPEFVEAQVRAEEDSGTHAELVQMTGAEVYSAASSMLEFCGACRLMLDPPAVPFTQPIVQTIRFMRSVPIRSSGITALVSGLRATLAVALVGAFWIASGWTNGSAAVVAAGITSGFFSLSPTPAMSSWQAFIGCLFAGIVGFCVNFMLMPVLGDVALFALVIAGVIFAGSYVNSFAQYVGLGAIFNIYFCYVLTPGNVAVYDPPYLLDRSFALLTGIAASACAFSLLLPREGEWLIRKLKARIRDLSMDAASGETDADLSVQIGRAIRDSIVRIVTVPGVSKEERDRTTTWAFGQFWIASALLQIRKLSAEYAAALPPAWRDIEREWLHAMESVARSSEAHSVAHAAGATGRCLNVLKAAKPADSRALFQLRAQLYSLRAALSDRLPAASQAEVAMS